MSKRNGFGRDPIARPILHDEVKFFGECVYFIQETTHLAIKIGYSTNPEKRMADLQSANAYPLVMLGVIVGGDEATEFELHQRFREYRLCGEWFSKDITDEVLNLIEADAIFVENEAAMTELELARHAFIQSHANRQTV